MIEITDAERVVMNALWGRSSMRSSEIVQAVAADRDWNPKTVNTLIRRLVDKGAVRFEKSIGGYLYSPLIAREDYRSHETRRLIHDLFDGKLTPLLACVATADDLSQSDLAQLRKLAGRLSK